MKLSRPRVLVIDDDEFLRKGLEFAMSKLGVETVLTAEPTEFMSRVEAAPAPGFDLYLIDLNLAEGGSGLELVRRIRALRGPKPRIMMISASGDNATIQAAIQAGANDYILKPLDRAHLAAKLCRYFLTQAMAESDAPQSLPADARTPGKLEFSAGIVEIDERGVRIEGPHLVPKGTALWIGGELVSAVSGATGARARIPVKVVSTWVSADACTEMGAPAYGAFAEFDRSRCDLRWFRSLRRWLAEASAPSPRAR